MEAASTASWASAAANKDLFLWRCATTSTSPTARWESSHSHHAALWIRIVCMSKSDLTWPFSGELHLLGLCKLPRLPRLVSSGTCHLKVELSGAALMFLCSLTVPTVRLCLVGAADTPGCVSLLPASLFSNSNPGCDRQRRVIMVFGCLFTNRFSSSDQPGMLCSFKISSAWSCAWCLNPQFDKTFSTGLSRRYLYYATVDLALVLWFWSKPLVCRPLSSGDTETCRNGPDTDIQHWQRRSGSAVCAEGETPLRANVLCSVWQRKWAHALFCL